MSDIKLDINGNPTPLPALVEGLGWEPYNDVAASRWSTVKHALRSPLHARAALMADRRESAALRRGRAVDAAVLSPRYFRDAYRVGPDWSPQSNRGKMLKAWADDPDSVERIFCPGPDRRGKGAKAARDAAVLAEREAAEAEGRPERHMVEQSSWDAFWSDVGDYPPGVVFATQEELDLWTAAGREARAELSMAYGLRSGLVEPSVFGEINGHPAKGRPDLVIDGDLVDVKSSEILESQDKAAATAWRYGYFGQLATYETLLAQVGVEVQRWAILWVGVERDGVVWSRLQHVDVRGMQLGREQSRRAWDAWTTAIETGEWSPPLDRDTPLSPPGWAR